MSLEIEFDREEDGRWIADIPALPGVMVYGHSQVEASLKVRLLAAQVISDRLEHGEATPDFGDFFVNAVASGDWIGPKALTRLTESGLDQVDF